MARELQLDARLKKAAQYVRQGAVFADVGCDHGRLSVYLVQQCGACRGYACDIRPQPLEKARQLIERKGLKDRVTPILTDGLQGLEGKGITDVIIAGIGGEVLAHIVEKAPFVQDPELRLILQPQSREHILRRTLCRLGFAIEQEQVVQAKGFLYTVLVSRYTAQPRELSDYEAYTGRLASADSPLARQKLLKISDTLLSIARGMHDCEQKREEARRVQVLAEQIKRTAQGPHETKGDVINGSLCTRDLSGSR